MVQKLFIQPEDFFFQQMVMNVMQANITKWVEREMLYIKKDKGYSKDNNVQ